MSRQTEGTVIRSKSLCIAALICLVGGAVAGGWAYRNAQRYKHFVVHEPGRVYRSAWLEADAMAEMVRKYQLRAVVNLCKPGEMGNERWAAERQAVQGAGARLIELSMPLQIDPADPLVAAHVEILRDPDNYPMLVHCQHGVTRTAKFLVLYDVLIREMSADKSLHAMPLFGREDYNVHVRAFTKLLDENRAKDLSSASADQPEAARR